jgi:DNA mismatch repair ATPase MutS
MNHYKIDFYSQRIEIFTASKNTLNRQIRLLGWSRLFVFIVGCFSFYKFLTTYQNLNLFITLSALFVFLLLLFVNHKLSSQRDTILNLIKINENEIAVLEQKASFFDAGTNYLNDDNYLADLDIFGIRSLFHQLNRTTTQIGRERLAALLIHPLSNVDEIKQQQVAVAELAEKTDLRHIFTAIGLKTESHNPDYESIMHWLESPDFFTTSRLITFLKYLAPTLILATILGGVITGNYFFINYAILINLMIAGYFIKSINVIHKDLSKNLTHFSEFADMLLQLENEKFSSPKMQQINQTARVARKELKGLAKLGNNFDQRTNLLVSLLLNATILMDIRLAYKLEKWKQKNSKSLPLWLDTIAEIEMLSSLATFRFNYPATIFPEVVSGKPFIKAVALAHPLIPSNECVANDITIGEQQNLFIVTGSNMSGKSTFLRTIGVNVLLARCGAPVFATGFRCSILNIHTSLRQTDSLLDHVSLFFSELRKLKSILNRLADDSNALVLLDEVLRGTNSDDKLHGSRQLVKKFVETGCLTILATHDVALSEMSRIYPEVINNYCFESSLENNELTFDYKLKEGVSKNRNATFLMKKMGIIE